MKIIYFVKYATLESLAFILNIAGTPPLVDDLFFERTNNYFTRLGDTRRAFKTYLANKNINEKPYFLKDGFTQKGEFKMSVVAMTDEDLKATYPLTRK